MPLQAIMPQFSRGITTAMSNAQQSVQSIGDMASKYLADEENKRRYEEGKAERAAERTQQQSNWEKSFSLQEAADKRAQEQDARQATEFDRKIQGQNMMSYMDAATSDVMNRGYLDQKGQTKLLGEYDRLVKSGMLPQDAGVVIGNLYETDKGAYRKVPMDTKSKIAAVEGVNLGSGELQYDPSLALGQKDKLLTGLRNDLQSELNRDQQMALLKTRMAFDAAENAKNRKAAEAKEPTFEPFFVTQVTKDGTSKIAVKNPAQLASISRYDPKTGAFLGLKEGFTMGDFTPKSETDRKASTVYTPDRVTSVDKIFGSWYKPDRSAYILQAADAVTRMKTQSGKKIDPDTAIGIVDAARKKGGTMGIWDNIRLQDINAELLHRGYIKDVESEGLKADNKFE